MSIIERVAELLGSESQTQQKPAATVPTSGKSGPDLIERALGEAGRRPGIPEEKSPAADPRVKDRPARIVRTSRTFKVDRELLRRQSMITPDGERTPVAESFRRIKRQVLTNVMNPRDAGLPANLVLVTSASSGEGKSYCAINLAISIALEMDRTVLLVDADVARPSIPRVLDLDADKGLMDVLFDRRIDLAQVLWKTDIGNLSVMPAGTPRKHATELLASGAMRALLHEMAQRYHDRIIVFDSPPLLAASEASVLASLAGQIVVVVEAGNTSEAALKDALSRIDTSKVTGLLLNKGEISSVGYGYGYG